MYFSVNSVKFNVRCLALNLASLEGNVNLWDIINLKLLRLQCYLGIDIEPESFLYISYAIVVFLVYFVWKKMCHRSDSLPQNQRPNQTAGGQNRFFGGHTWGRGQALGGD